MCKSRGTAAVACAFGVHWGAARCGVVQEVVGGGGGVVSSTDHSTTGVFVV